MNGVLNLDYKDAQGLVPVSTEGYFYNGWNP